MFRSLNVDALGVTGRQSEIIELALTYGFRGLDLNMERFMKRVETQGLDRARRFLDSANMKVGTFELPIRWRGTDDQYRASLDELRRVAEVAQSLHAQRCHVTVEPVSDELPYHENFEAHRARLAEMAELLDEYEVRLGVGLLASPARREQGRYQFIHQAEPLVLLIKSAGDRVGLALDTWNWHFGDGGMDQLQELGVERVVSLRLADAPADAEAQSITDEQRVLPGEGGIVDSLSVIKWLSDGHYNGPVSPTPHQRQATGMTRDNIVQRAASSLDDLFRAAGILRPIRAEQPAGAEAGEGEE